nr:PREDICTED: reticulon-4 isoform X1 [Lepisosteus oculatus]
MEDAQHISSTTPGVDELRKLQGDPDKMDESKLYDEAAGYLLQESGGGSPRPLADDDILDLAGGARDALLRHRSATPPGTGDPDRDLYSEFAPAAEPGDLLTGMGGFGAPSVKQAADSPPKPEPPRAAPRSPASDPSPASSSSSSSAASSPDEPIFSSSAPSQPLVQSSAERSVDMQEQPCSTRPVDQKEGTSVLGTVAPVSSTSPLPSPDSLEELSLSESPNKALSLAAPFASCPVQVADAFAQIVVQDVPLNEEVKNFECKTQTDNMTLRLDAHQADNQVRLDDVSMKIVPDLDASQIVAPSLFPLQETLNLSQDTVLDHKEEASCTLETLLADSASLKTVVMEPEKPVFCKDSEVMFSSDIKLGDSKETYEEEKMDSDREERDSYPHTSEEAAGSTLPQLLPNTETSQGVGTQHFVTYATFDPAVNFDSPPSDSKDDSKVLDVPSEDDSALNASSFKVGLPTGQAEVGHEVLLELKTSAALDTSVQKESLRELSPIDVSSGGLPQYSETVSEDKAAEMSESPTPDLVQDAYDNDLQDLTPTKHQEETPVDLVQMISDSAYEPLDPSMHLPPSTKESEGSAAPPSLPDILKSSPLGSSKPEIVSSEGTPDSETSPDQEHLQEPRDVSPSIEAAKLTAFEMDSKIPHFRETAGQVAFEEAEKKDRAFEQVADKGLSTCDLVKEAQSTTDHKDQFRMEPDGKDWMNFTCPDAAQSLGSHESQNPEPPIDLTASHAPKESVPEESDSESPMTDSLSPVLEAMAKNPAIFQVEIERYQKDTETSTTPETQSYPESGTFLEEADESVELEEAFEQEGSSEEFEMIERPPVGSRGVIDEFLETLDNSKFAKTSEAGTDDEPSPGFGKDELVPDIDTEFHVRSQLNSYTILSEPTPGPLPQKVLLDLEAPAVCSEEPKMGQAQEIVPEDVHLHDPRVDSTVEETEKLVSPPPPPPPTAEDKPSSREKARLEAPKATHLPPLNTEKVVDLLYWRDIKRTGVVFGASLFLLLSLTVCSIVSVCSYLALALLSVTVTFRIYKGVLQAVQKSDEGHPFKAYLESDVALSEELVHKYSDVALSHLNCGLKELRRLFLVEDLVDSLKFAVLMWILTYVGALFNGLTLLILALISVFSIPVIYERHQAQIDHYLGLVNNQVKDIIAKIQAKVPGLKRKAE